MSESRINKQIKFLYEVDKLKAINRATILGDKSRRENSAEHSWHVSLFALIFSEHAKPGVDLFKALKMLLIHDIVEIDAGDNPIFGTHDLYSISVTERKAAQRIFKLLPKDQALEMLDIWTEFEDSSTPTAQFARSMDRFQAPNQNLMSGGGTWIEYNVKYDQIEKKVGSKIALGAPRLWDWLKPRLQEFLYSKINRTKEK